MARREFLVVRHPKPKLADDWYMLDRWTPDVAHTVTSKYRDVLKDGVVVEQVYRSVCVCGWRSSEFHKPTQDVCPVGQALQQRARRLARTEHVIWLDVKDEPTT